MDMGDRKVLLISFAGAFFVALESFSLGRRAFTILSGFFISYFHTTEPLYFFPPIRRFALFQVLNTRLIILGSATIPFSINMVSQSFKFINISMVKCFLSISDEV